MVTSLNVIRASAVLLVMLVRIWHADIAHAQSALDLDGKSVNPLIAAQGKVVALVFVRRDCPISGRYAPSIQRISNEFAGDVDFWLVYPDKDESADTIRKNLQEYGYNLPALRNPDHELIKLAQVKMTPEVAVFDRNRQLVYDGRIDNWYQDVTRARPVPTTHEFEDAIRAALAGNRMARTEIRGVGCYISDLQ